MLADPDFLAAMAKRNVMIEPATGEAMDAVTTETMGLPKSTSRGAAHTAERLERDKLSLNRRLIPLVPAGAARAPNVSSDAVLGHWIPAVTKM